MLTSTNKTEKRLNSILPNGIPKYIRCYDDGGKSLDRYTVVFTKKRPGGITLYVGMSGNPFHPQGFGQHGEQKNPIDVPSYSHLGKKIKFQDLPEDCQKLVLRDYKDLWNIQ